jgi:hypothetical protein
MTVNLKYHNSIYSERLNILQYLFLHFHTYRGHFTQYQLRAASRFADCEFPTLILFPANSYFTLFHRLLYLLILTHTPRRQSAAPRSFLYYRAHNCIA